MGRIIRISIKQSRTMVLRLQLTGQTIDFTLSESTNSTGNEIAVTRSISETTV